MKVFEVMWKWQRHPSSTSFGTREDADKFAAALRKRGVKQVWVREV